MGGGFEVIACFDGCGKRLEVAVVAGLVGMLNCDTCGLAACVEAVQNTACGAMEGSCEGSTSTGRCRKDVRERTS